MTTTEANNIAIKTYLNDSGIYPVKEKEIYGMYCSPFRQEADASFKVDYRQNLWYDFGLGEGGTTLDLVMRLHRCSLPEAIRQLENHSYESFSFHGRENTANSTIVLQSVLPLTNKALIDYLAERKINIEIAKQYCKEIHYSIGDKPYFAIGFKNDMGGYELRNKYFKGCTSKDISTFDNTKSQCCVFEGFMDMLSYFTLKSRATVEANVLVLNSVVNLSKAAKFLNRQDTIHAFLDNDEAGKQALKLIQATGKTVVDQSAFYRGFKDLNEYLCNRTPKHTVARTKRRRL